MPNNFAKITPVSLGNIPNKATIVAQSAGVFGTAAATNGQSSATYGVHFKMSERDDKYLIIIQHNTPGDSGASVDVTIKAGNNGKWSNGDYTFAVAKNKVAFVQIESGRFKSEAPNDTLKALATNSSDASSYTENMKGDVVITASSAQVSITVVKVAF